MLTSGAFAYFSLVIREVYAIQLGIRCFWSDIPFDLSSYQGILVKKKAKKGFANPFCGYYHLLFVVIVIVITN